MRQCVDFLRADIDSGPLDIDGVAQIADALGLEWELRDRGTSLSIQAARWSIQIDLCYYVTDGIEAIAYRDKDNREFLWRESQHVIDSLVELIGKQP